MSLRRQFRFTVCAWCALVIAGLSANAVRAQCAHGGHHHHGGSPGMFAGQLLQAQQLMMQQQLVLQQIQQAQQQQQLLQTARLNRKIGELVKQGPEAIKGTLKDAQAEMRFIGAVAAGKIGPGLEKELIERLTDDSAAVRQAARRSLVSLSNKLDGKPSGRRVDFGPLANATATAQKSAALKWTTWLDQQQKPKTTGKSIRLRDTALSDLAHRQHKQKDEVKTRTAQATPLTPVAVDRKTNP